MTEGSVRGCSHLADSPPPPAPGTRGVFLLTGLPLAYRFHTIVPGVATLDIVEHEFLARRPDHTLRVVDEFGAEHVWPYDAYLDSLAVAARRLTPASMIDASDVVVLGHLKGRYFDRDASSVLAIYWWFQVERILAGCPVPERVIARVEVDERPTPDRIVARIEHRVVDERFKRLSALETQVVVFADTLPGGQLEPVGLGALEVENDGSIALPFPRVGEHVDTRYLPLSAVRAR